jgi:hypothetical protein
MSRARLAASPEHQVALDELVKSGNSSNNTDAGWDPSASPRSAGSDGEDDARMRAMQRGNLAR